MNSRIHFSPELLTLSMMITATTLGLINKAISRLGVTSAETAVPLFCLGICLVCAAVYIGLFYCYLWHWKRQEKKKETLRLV